MRTPAGRECRYYYEDHYRGRQQQECRLLTPVRAHTWRPSLCASCPVPSFLLANACPNLVLAGEVRARLLGLQRRMQVSAHCRLSGREVAEPPIGCGQCHLHLEEIQPGFHEPT